MPHPTKVHRSKMSRATKVAVWIVGVVGTFQFFAGCVVLTFVPTLFHQTLFVVQFVSSAFLQLVLLPLILIAGNVQADHLEKIADHIYQHTTKVEALLVAKRGAPRAR